jgi:hypothetical protein
MSLVRLENRLGWRGAAVAATVFAAAVTSSADARASGPVQTWGKGTAGGALLGGEVIVIPLGAAGVNRGWPYFVFGGLGMVGGAIGGYFVDKQFAVQTNAMGVVTSGGPAEPSIFMLAGGLALVIPALVVSLNATAYRPPEGDRPEPANNRPARDAPVSPQPPDAQPGAAPPGGVPAPAPADVPPRGASFYHYRSSYRTATAGLPHIPTSLLDMYAGKVGFGLPAAQVKPLYSQAEMSRFGVNQGTEVRLPVFKALF